MTSESKMWFNSLFPKWATNQLRRKFWLKWMHCCKSTRETENPKDLSSQSISGRININESATSNPLVWRTSTGGPNLLVFKAFFHKKGLTLPPLVTPSHPQRHPTHSPISLTVASHCLTPCTAASLSQPRPFHSQRRRNHPCLAPQKRATHNTGSGCGVTPSRYQNLTKRGTRLQISTFQVAVAGLYLAALSIHRTTHSALYQARRTHPNPPLMTYSCGTIFHYIFILWAASWRREGLDAFEAILLVMWRCKSILRRHPDSNHAANVVEIEIAPGNGWIWSDGEV